MPYDKSHIPALADDVVNGRIDETTAIALFSEDLQRILKVEIGNRLRSRGYDRDNIGNTTDKGIPYLADDIVLGLVKESDAFNLLKFKLYHKPLTEEISKRRKDEILWNEALASQTIEMFEKYLDTYNNPDSTYTGRYVTRAEEFIELIAADDKEWATAKRLDAENAYLHYLEIYDKPEPLYRGKHIKEVKASIVRLKDNKDWNIACELNSLQSYSGYLSLYDKVAPNYIGLHVKEAHLAVLRITDEADWSHASNLNTIESYESYLNKYDVDSPTYRGMFIDDAKEAIKSLAPPPAPEPRIKDDEAWVKATKLNTKEAYQEYLNKYGLPSAEGYIGVHIKEAEWEIRHIIDEEAWKKAKSLNTIDSYQEYKNTCDANDYPGYSWAHYNTASTNIGNLKKSEEIRAQKEEDEADWNEATRQNTIDAYKQYLSIHGSGIHKKDAQDVIVKFEKQAFANQENKDWQSACKSNTLSAYGSFVSKYSDPSLTFKPTHLDAAKQKIAELTPPAPVPTHIKWWKWITVIAVLVLGWLTYVQWYDCAWPFNIKSDDVPIPIDVEQIDSLQWAIDNKNIPLLTKYAEMDSTRAYYPLALALNAHDSVANVEKTLHWLDIVLDPDVNSLHQNIINDIQQKELDELATQFNAIDPNEKDADQKYLAVYKDYIRHFERLATHTPRITIQYMPIEDMANAQIADRKKHEELRTSILREWQTQQSRLRTILSNIDDNAKKAYSNNP